MKLFDDLMDFIQCAFWLFWVLLLVLMLYALRTGELAFLHDLGDSLKNLVYLII